MVVAQACTAGIPTLVFPKPDVPGMSPPVMAPTRSPARIATIAAAFPGEASAQDVTALGVPSPPVGRRQPDTRSRRKTSIARTRGVHGRNTAHILPPMKQLFCSED